MAIKNIRKQKAQEKKIEVGYTPPSIRVERVRMPVWAGSCGSCGCFGC